MKSIRAYCYPALLIAFGICVGYVLSSMIGSDMGDNHERRSERHSGSSASGLTNPLLECDIGREYISENSIRPFRDIIKKEIDGLITEKKAVHISYYFRDLNNGSWFGFDEKEMFTPASLLKVPLLLYTLRQTEKDAALINTPILYDKGEVNLSQFIPLENPIEIGKTYTVRELLEHMILDSDNNATSLILRLLGPEKVKTIYSDVGISLTTSETEAGEVSVRDYATFFRILFNASYLGQTASEAALSLLTKTKFKDGIVAGVPGNVIVAHKFGERGVDRLKQLHDCGIVYALKTPYLICIMTRGYDFSTLANIIAKLSRTTYDEVHAQLR